MRQYRGLTKDGKWVYGCYLFDNSYGDNRSVHLIFPFEKIAQLTTILHTPMEGEVKRFTGECYQVIPETVGQQIGRKDKAKVEIYKGDVVRLLIYREYSSSPSTKDKYRNEVVTNGCRCGLRTDGMISIKKEGQEEYEAQLEIIGNIHENPELFIKECLKE